MPASLGRIAFLFLLPTLPAAAPLEARALCLSVQTAQVTADYPIEIGDRLSLIFRHSIYGSQVEEQLRLSEHGLQPVEYRYAEPRLVEFYGHESAIRAGGRWIVRKPGPVLPSLDLHASQAASIRIALRGQTLALPTQPHGRARLTVGVC